MIWQLHHQFRDGHLEMQAQKEFPLSGKEGVDSINDRFQLWFNKIKNSHPVPQNAQWLVCNQKDTNFLVTP